MADLPAGLARPMADSTRSFHSNHATKGAKMRVQGMIGLVGVLVLAPMAQAWAAEAPCCASGDNGRPNAIMARSLTDLGQSSPTVTNESRQSDYQAFVFTRNARRFIEIADAAGTPRAAFTIVHGGLLTLPVGSDEVQQVAFAPATPDVVYDDQSVVVGIRRGADGSTSWQVYIK